MRELHLNVFRGWRSSQTASPSSELLQIKSFTVLSDLSAEAFFFSSDMIECFGFTSIVFFETMYEVIELSRNACAFMMRSMFADQPYSDVVKTHGESAMRVLTTTFSVLSPKTSFISLVRGSNSAFNSSNFFLLILIVDVQTLF